MAWLKIVAVATVAALAVGLAVLHRVSPGLLQVARDVEEITVRAHLVDLRGAYLIEGMIAAENLYLDPSSQRVYATDLAGSIHLVDGPSWDELSIVRSVRLGRSALGVDRGPDGNLYVCVSNVSLRKWRTMGGSVVRVDPDLQSWTQVTHRYPSINGLAFDGDGRAYFASSRFTPLCAQGGVYMMHVAPGGEITSPELHIAGLGMTNGLRLSSTDGWLYFTETAVGVFAFAPGSSACVEVYHKARRIEGFDDVCVDDQSRVWMADPGRSTVKLYDVTTKRLVRFRIDGVGQISACALRRDNGRAILYLTEIHRSRSPLSGARDGRGVFAIPVDELLGLLPAQAEGPR